MRAVVGLLWDFPPFCTDARGCLLAILLTGGEAHDCPVAECLIRRVKSPKRMLGDKAYDSAELREELNARGTKPVIPNRCSTKQPFSFSRLLYKLRSRIESAFNISSLSPAGVPADAPQSFSILASALRWYLLVGLMNDHTKSPDRSASSYPVLLLLVSSVVIILSFVLACVRAPLWYDESIYLTLSESIRGTGYPVWFWVPEKPQLFLSSPPAILYFISFLPTWISSNVVLTRILFIVLFGLSPFVFLIAQALRNGASLFPISAAALFAACSGLFLMELIQVRLDLPLACLSCLALVSYADAGDSARVGRGVRSWLSLCFIFLLSVLSFLTKFQAVCLTGALVLDVMLTYLLAERRVLNWLALFTHLLGAGLAISIFVWWASSSEYASVAALSGNVYWNIVDRIFPSHDLTKEVIVLSSVAKQNSFEDYYTQHSLADRLYLGKDRLERTAFQIVRPHHGDGGRV